MRFKKAASLLAAAAVVTSAFSFSASAASYTYTMEDLASAPIVKTGTPGNIGENGALDPIWDKVEPVELRQKGQNDVTRPGLTGEVKTLWDQQKFYVLLKVTGDQKVVDGDTVYKTASWEDEVNVMLMQTWATVDEEIGETLGEEYLRDSFSGSVTDLLFQTRRMAKSDFEPRKLETFDWISADVYAASKALLDKGGVNVQSCEVNEGETMLMQIAIDWIDPAIAQDGRIIGLDLDYGDWLGAAESVEGALEKPNGTPGKAHLYFSQNNFENWGDDASANAPMVLSDIPADMDEAVAALKEMLDAIPDAADITLEDEEGVALVRALYDELSKELTEEQKAQLADSYARLTAAEAKIAELKASSSSSESSEPDSSSSVSDSSSSSNENSTSSNASNPETGVPAAALPLILLAGAAAVVAVCRKKSNG